MHSYHLPESNGTNPDIPSTKLSNPGVPKKVLTPTPPMNRFGIYIKYINQKRISETLFQQAN